MSDMSLITDFYINNGEDNKGRTLKSILEKSDIYLETSHDIIQWLFPLHEKSYHSINSPVLTKEDVEILQSSLIAKENMILSLRRFCKFLGLLPYDQNKIRVWCNNGNHNLLRITRIIRSLRLFGINDKTIIFYEAISKLAKEKGISNNTLEYWEKAYFDDVWNSMTDKFLEEKEIKIFSVEYFQK
jgi:hypothetical protein